MSHKEKIYGLKKKVEKLQQENEYLKQLAEKDKEIEKLKEELAENENIIDFHMKNNIYNVALKDYSVLAPYPKNMAQIIRHEICEKIREQIHSSYIKEPMICSSDGDVVLACIYISTVNKILNQIEQGDE